MSRVRDDARRNARQQFASKHTDGSPVGSVLLAFQDGCVDGYTEAGDVFTSSFTSDHCEADHAPWLRAPFSYERFNDLTYVDDYYDEVSS